MQDLQELQGCQLAVAGGGVVGEDCVSGLLAADAVAALQTIAGINSGAVSGTCMGYIALRKDKEASE